MGNTSSSGKDKKPGLPNQTESNIQGNDSDDEAAHVASQPIAESTLMPKISINEALAMRWLIMFCILLQ